MYTMTLILNFVYLILIVSCFSKCNNNLKTIVQIESGLIRGHILKSENGNDFWSFQEIPYAAPPVGKNRFRLPEAPAPWNGIKNTTKNTKICYQNSSRFPDLEISEDCLYINVYTPVKPGSRQLIPVLFWIHGGSSEAESGVYEYYGPKYLMDYGVVVVSINYRLNAFGFVSTDDDVIPYALGIKDQVFAMQWVNRNIHKFGGNNRQIILAGESSGSINVGMHLIGPWPNNVPLFHAAIMQSGSVISLNGLILNQSNVAFQLAKALDPIFSPKNTTDLLHFLQQAKAEDILATGITGTGTIQPRTVGGFQSFLDNNYKKVPVLIGFNSEEALPEQTLINNTYLAELDANPSLLISQGFNMSPANRTLAGTLLKKLYTNNSSFVNHPGSYIRYTSDLYFTTAICKLVELGSNNVPYFFYQFAYKGNLGGQMEVKPLEGTGRVGHAEDLRYMWEEYNANSDLSKFPVKDQLTLHRLVKLWTNFAKYFNPTPENDPLLENIKWLKSEPRTLRYLNINGTLEMRKNPRQYQQVKTILETYMEPPFNYFS